MDTTLLIVILAIGALVVLGGLLYIRRWRHDRLQARFGPEYERTLHEVGNVKRAEAALTAREKRVAKFHIRRLEPDQASRFAEVWRHVQALFVDDPKAAISEADRLVGDVMTARGYPVVDFDQRVADISVDHPLVVEHYRAARDLARRNQQGLTSTEDLRQAMIHYRTLFDDLLGTKERPPEPEPVRR